MGMERLRMGLPLRLPLRPWTALSACASDRATQMMHASSTTVKGPCKRMPCQRSHHLLLRGAVLAWGAADEELELGHGL
jgi:hypothetical protein